MGRIFQAAPESKTSLFDYDTKSKGETKTVASIYLTGTFFPHIIHNMVNVAATLANRLNARKEAE